MTEKHEPMSKVRETLKIPWYRSPVEPARLKELTRRSDLRGTFQALGHLVLLAITAAATWYFFGHRIWAGFTVALFAHGTIYSFLSGLATHELAHGTVFKTKWLNSFFVRFMSLISWFNFHDYKVSHTYHHLYTLHPRGDREVVLPNTPSLHPLFLLQLFTLNLVGTRNEPYSFPIVQNVAATVRLAFTGRFGKEWLRAVYEGQEEARKKSVNWARLTLLFHAALIAVSVVFRLWMLPVLVTLAPFIANWLRYFVGVPMHTGLKDNNPDFRKCVRTITLDPFSSFIYWRMNWHTEHHMYAAVPCYSLKRLASAIADDMPAPRSLVGAWKEMRETWHRQQKDPKYQFDTSLPRSKGAGVAKGGKGGKTGKAGKAGRNALASSLGNLAPKELE
jgi:fatty acid desaturase